jgi:ATP-dependent DNA helicase RecG
MEETTDGFKIAEIDLELRGPGDFFGTRQSGMPGLRLANLIADGNILAAARREAFALVGNDPELREERHRKLRHHVEEYYRDALDIMEVG